MRPLWPTETPDTPSAQPSNVWDELVCWISPRRTVRVDPDGTHTYARTRGVADGEPQDMPYALHLTTAQHRYAHVVFDLDTSRDGLAQVWRDADTLTGALAEAELGHVVSRSGPGGGIHIWVPVSEEEGLEPVDVATLARAVARHLPSLDTGALTNPSTGAVRPPGAPHRAGGRAELIHPGAPEDALSVFDTPGNTRDRFQDLAEAFGAAADEDEPEDTGTGGVEARIDREAVRLRGRRQMLPDMVRHLLDTAPEADTSAHLARILPRLALARWSLADVRALVAAEPAAPGLEHLRTRRFDRGRRHRKDADRDAVLTRQWTKAVEFAAGASPAWDRTERDLTGLRTLAEQILDAVAEHQWWSSQAGQADARTLLAVLHVALRSGQEEVDVDVRRVALAAGLGKSTAARALTRLCSDGRLAQTAAAEGTHAARYRLACPTEWPGHNTHNQGGTQGIPPRADPSQETSLPTREDLLHRVAQRLENASHDVWAEHSPTHPRGLGRHVEATYAALTEQSTHLDAVNLDALGDRTGYTVATTARHLRILTDHGLIDPVTLRPTTPVETALDAAAEALGTTGTRAAREARYEAERQMWAAWQDELARMRAPVALRPRRARRERYARTRTGRPDHAAQLAHHLAAAA